MTTVWAHLPNARYIDQVLASLRSYPSEWVLETLEQYRSWHTDDETNSTIAYDRWNTAWNTAYERSIATAAMRNDRDAIWAVVTTTGRRDIDVHFDAIAALIAWDDCAYMLESDVGELKIIATFGDPRAILLLPACTIFNRTKKYDNCLGRSS